MGSMSPYIAAPWILWDSSHCTFFIQQNRTKSKEGAPEMVGRMRAADARMQVNASHTSWNTPSCDHPLDHINTNMKQKAERRKILGYPLAIFYIAMEAMAHWIYFKMMFSHWFSHWFFPIDFFPLIFPLIFHGYVSYLRHTYVAWPEGSPKSQPPPFSTRPSGPSTTSRWQVLGRIDLRSTGFSEIYIDLWHTEIWYTAYIYMCVCICIYIYMCVYIYICVCVIFFQPPISEIWDIQDITDIHHSH